MTPDLTIVEGGTTSLEIPAASAELEVSGAPSFELNVVDGLPGAQGPQGETGATGPQGPTGVYVQKTRPTASGPWHWWVTDAAGAIINLIVNDGTP